MSLKVYIGGKLYDKADAKISVYDHGLLYGDGVFEGIRSYAGRVFRLTQHVDRLYESATVDPPADPDRQGGDGRAIVDTLAVNKLNDAYIRLVVTRGAGSLGLDPRKTTDPQVIIITDAISLYPARAVRARPEDRHRRRRLRNHPSALNPRIKSLNYLNNILAKIEGTNAGCLEALMLNHKGEVAECTGDNIFVVQQGRAAHPADRRRHPRRDHPRRRDRAGPGGRVPGLRADDGPARHLHRRRMLPDRHGRRGDSGRRVRRPRDRHRQARPDHATTSSSGSTRWSAKSDERGASRRGRDPEDPGTHRLQPARGERRAVRVRPRRAPGCGAASAPRPLRDRPDRARSAPHAGPPAGILSRRSKSSRARPWRS